MWGSCYIATPTKSNISTTLRQHFSFVIMPRNLMLTLLRKGNTGSDILSILDVIAEDNPSSSDDTQGDAVSYSTGEAIAF